MSVYGMYDEDSEALAGMYGDYIDPDEAAFGPAGARLRPVIEPFDDDIPHVGVDPMIAARDMELGPRRNRRGVPMTTREALGRGAMPPRYSDLSLPEYDVVGNASPAFVRHLANDPAASQLAEMMGVEDQGPPHDRRGNVAFDENVQFMGPPESPSRLRRLASAFGFMGLNRSNSGRFGSNRRRGSFGSFDSFGRDGRDPFDEQIPRLRRRRRSIDFGMIRGEQDMLGGPEELALQDVGGLLGDRFGEPDELEIPALGDYPGDDYGSPSRRRRGRRGGRRRRFSLY